MAARLAGDDGASKLSPWAPFICRYTSLRCVHTHTHTQTSSPDRTRDVSDCGHNVTSESTVLAHVPRQVIK